MNGLPDTINREAHKQAKGFRLQKLRAIQLILEKIEEEENIHVYCAIEYQGDIYSHSSTATSSSDYYEEDKNYLSSSFSFNSSQVTDTLINFIDVWHKHDFSEKDSFCFLATSSIAKERTTRTTKRLSLTIPNDPILETLSKKTQIDNITLTYIKSIVLDAYKKAYSPNPKNPNNRRGNLSSITKWEDDDWLAFLKHIEWRFNNDVETDIEVQIIDSIQKSQFYSPELSGKEQSVIDKLYNKLDRKQSLPDYADRFLHGSEVILLFREVQIGHYRLPDPAWKEWVALPKPVDNRNLQDKILSVCNSENHAAVDIYCKKASLSRLEQKELSSRDRSSLAIKYRIYLCCAEELQRFTSKGGSLFSSDEIRNLIDALTNKCLHHINEQSRSWAYFHISESLIQGIILELVDSCFLSFDNGHINE